ncbi:1,4-dihydroxy-2-naphthoyl-CoA thioesterase 1-like isoform X1 [Typha angustifolia]|uniref:1,4-dihydroxy-2-naphthoyl-CoA thioesterase 1-like isoform X1 n=1 Tax=Typha angustifolia TaxID=59011 RepID=UPI003C2C569A
MSGTTNFSSSSNSKPVIDNALHALGFVYTQISPEKVTGRLKVTLTCCQPFKVLNGGVSALIAESTASLGGYVASGYGRVAGVQLSVNHLKPAALGEEIEAEAKPIHLGRTTQVWEVQIRRIEPSTSESKVLLSTSRVVLVGNLHTPKDMKYYEEAIKKYSKL